MDFVKYDIFVYYRSVYAGYYPSIQSTIAIIITIEGIRTNKEKGVNLDPPFLKHPCCANILY